MTDTRPVARRVVVRGEVQGVFFRESCKQEADSRGVAGWVRNRPDGAVEALFEGPAADVDQLVSWANTGPRQASVDACEVSDEEVGGLTGFEVRG